MHGGNGGSRTRARSRMVVVLLGGLGLLFAAATVHHKQRAWEQAQRPAEAGRIVLGEDYAQEMGGGQSAAQQLAALRKRLERTSLELQGSDRATSTAIRREETLAARPTPSAFEQGASAEWAAGGAQQEWARGGARADWLVGGATRQHELHAASHELAVHRQLGGESTGALKTDTASVLAQSAQSLAQDIQQEERYGHKLGAPYPPVTPAASVTPSVRSAQAPASEQPSSALAQQLSQIWQGRGAVYAPSVMTPYQQQMLQGYLGSPTLATPQAAGPPPATTQQGGRVQQPPTQLHGAALTAAWKAYLDPETVHSTVPAAAPAPSAPAPVVAKAPVAVVQLAGVGKAVEDVALDSDGVLQHAESIMSSVKKLLKRPLHDLAHVSDSSRNTAGAKKATQGKVKGSVNGKSAAVLKTSLSQQHESAIQKKLDTAEATHKKLEEERAHVLASEYKHLADSIKTKKGAEMSDPGKARTQQLVGLKPTGDKTAGKSVVSNTSSPISNATALKVLASKSKLGDKAAQESKPSTVRTGGNVSGAAALTHEKALPALPALPLDPAVVQETGLAKAGKKLEATGILLPPSDATLKSMQQQHKAVTRGKATAATVLEAKAESARAGKQQSRVEGRKARWGGDTPLIDVNIRDSKIEGGMHISRNTGKRKGPGAQSGCGALCELGKLVQNVQDGSYQSLSGHVPGALARAGKKMVEKDYVISHIGGKPVYAREMVPAPDAGTGGAAASSGAKDQDGLESTLERAIEREGEREGERRERRRERERDGDQWDDYRRRHSHDGDHEGGGGGGSHDMRLVLSKGDMDKEVKADDDTKPVKYKAVRYAIPVSEFEALSGQAAPSGSARLVPKHVVIDENSDLGRAALDQVLYGSI